MLLSRFFCRLSMADIAGLVLGGLPIALYCLDNYRRCLDSVTDWRRYEDTLKPIRNNVFLQQEQLNATLRTLGLHDPSPGDLQDCLRVNFPDRYDKFLSILERMGEIIQEMMDKLDVDAQGKV